jgi:glycosyltransferase involved in cell wall biosynthesis
MQILADVRSLQDPSYAARGIGSHAAFVLRWLRGCRVASGGIVGLVDPKLGPLSAENAALCDEFRPAFVCNRIDEPSMFLSLSPLTHNSLVQSQLLHRPHILPIAVVYDFIPMEFPDFYLANRDALAAYTAAFKWLDAFSAFLPISEHCGAEVVRRLGISADRASVTGVALREAFSRRLDSRAPPLARPDGVAAQTIFFVGGPDPRKNLETVVAAYSMLATHGQPELQLVVGGGYPDAWQHQVRKEVQGRTGRVANILFLGHISDEELVGWHAHATATVTASLAEGFSMPVIEAIASGGVSIVSDIPVHRELVNQPEALFSPTDAHDLATKLGAILRCSSLLDSLREQQRTVAERFAPEAVGRRLEAAIEGHVESFLVRRRTMPSRQRPRIAMVTPYPPDHSGVADYSKKCVESLAKFVDVDVYTDAHKPAANPAVKVFYPISAAAWLRPDYDAVIAVAGNSQYHTKILELHRKFGGPCIMHDNRLGELTAWWKGVEHLRKLAERSLGRVISGEEVSDWLANPASQPTLFYDELLEQTEPLFVHSEGIRAHALRLYGINVEYLPFCVYRDFTAEDISVAARRAARESLGIPQDQIVVISLGIVDAAKIPMKCIEAIAGVGERGIPAHLYFVGQGSSGVREPLSTLAASSGIADRVHFFDGWVSEDDYRRFIVAANAGIQLRAHFYGGISGALADCVAAGLPTVANEDLATAIDAPCYISRVPDRPAAEQLVDALSSCLIHSADRHGQEQARLAYSRKHNFDDYARRLLSRLLGPAPQWSLPVEPMVGLPTPPRLIKRMLVDATLTSRSPAGSGVHRVVTRTWQEIKRQAAQWGFVATQVVVRNGRFVPLGESQPIAFDADDLLLLPDAYWACGEVWPAVEKARAAGTKSVLLVYDLIPMQYPEIYGADGAAQFRHYVAAVVAHADLIVTISDTVASDLSVAMPSFRFPRRGPEIVPWRLGCDLPNVDGDVRSGVRALFDNRQPGSLYLTIGAIEPRKNHGFILDAFELLWADPATAHVRLAVAGRPGFKSEALLRRIKSNPRHGTRLFLLTDLDDAEIDYAYRHARAVVLASMAEGFCLPIVEALRYGQTVMASNLPIHREVGGENCDYFALVSPEGLTGLIARHEERHRGVAAARRDGITPVTWADATAQLWEVICDRLAIAMPTQ